jgi:hypothetical protein
MAKCKNGEWGEHELEYICRFVEHDGTANIATALNRRVRDIHAKIEELKEKGLFDHYKKMRKHWCC